MSEVSHSFGQTNFLELASPHDDVFLVILKQLCSTFFGNILTEKRYPWIHTPTED